MKTYCELSVFNLLLNIQYFALIPRLDGSPQSINLIGNLMTSVFPGCKTFIIYELQIHDKFISQDKLEEIVVNKEIPYHSGGFTLLSLEKRDLSSNNASQNNHSSQGHLQFRRTVRTFRTISEYVYNGYVVLILLPQGLERKLESRLHDKLNLPLMNPMTVRNRDKYIILTGPTEDWRNVANFEVIRKLKYKLIIPESENIFYQFCDYCPFPVIEISCKHINGNNLADYYFPDFQQNYFGSVLKVSATDKLPGLLEIWTDPETGINHPKRGVYASALAHLAKGLNFTWELHRSSGGGSTGHPLPNGTWVGTVGDAYNKKVDFGLVCGMTLIRHPIIELCATITFEYISFAIGPASPVYTWKAIFWPFNGFLWMGMVSSTFLVIFTSHWLFHFSGKMYQWSSWSLSRLAQYLPRLFIEQSEDFPSSMPQSIKILLGHWLIFALIGATVYRAKMVSFMTFPVLEHAPETFDGLARSTYEIDFHYFGNVAYNTFKTSTSPTYMKIFKVMHREPNPIECLKSTMLGSRACILFGCVFEELKNRNLSDRFGQSPIRISPNYGFMYTPGVLHEKNADFSPNFKWILQNSMQMGLNQQWLKTDMSGLLKTRNHWLESLSLKERPRHKFSYDFDENGDELHLKHLKGAFSVLFGGLFTATLGFFGECGRVRRIWEKLGQRFKCIRKNSGATEHDEISLTRLDIKDDDVTSREKRWKFFMENHQHFRPEREENMFSYGVMPQFT